MAMTQPGTGLISSGVEALIARLRDEGVAAGQQEAERLLAEARQQARQILHQAETQSAHLLETARVEAEALRKGGEEALRIAMRDTVLRLKIDLANRFGAEVRRLIATELGQQEFLRQLILEVAGQARAASGLDQGQAIEIRLPRALVSPDELRRNPLELREGSLSHFVLSLAGNLLAAGVTFAVDHEETTGIRLYLKDQDVHIDLTDDKVAQLLLAHLQPRFRAILDGTVR